MNWVDITIIFLLIIFAVDGAKRSFVGESLNFLSFLLALLFSLSFYNFSADFFQHFFKLPHSLANVLGFISVWFLVELGLFILIRIFFHQSKLVNYFDRHLVKLSFIPAFLRGVIFVSVMLILVAIFPLQPKIKLAVEKSQLGSFLLGQTSKLELPLKNVFGGISNDTLTFFTVRPNTNENIDLGFKINNFQARNDLEEQMIGLVNNERQKRGLKALTFDPRLREIARAHSSDMFKQGYFSHYSPEGETVAQRTEKKDISYQIIGENLAYAPELDLAHQGLMNSPGHRANILSAQFSKIGIGIMDGDVYGLMVTQVFTD